MKFAVQDLVMDERCQARDALVDDVAQEYAQAYLQNTKLPSIDVFLVDEKPLVIDGWHRVSAALIAGVAFLDARVLGQGDIDEAIWRSCSQNQSHGLRRSNADKRRAVWVALSSAIGQDQSNRAIAQHVGVHHDLVGELREQWERISRNGSDDAVCNDYDSLEGESGGSASPNATVSVNSKTAPKGEILDGMPDYDGEVEAVRKAFREARALSESVLPSALTGVRESIRRWCNDIDRNLKMAKPVICSNCKGKGCKWCNSLGWLSKGSDIRAQAKQD